MKKIVICMGLILMFAQAAFSMGACTSAQSELSTSTHQVDTAYIADHVGSVTLVDVRDFVDYAGKIDDEQDRQGHIPSAINIPYENLLDRSGEPISQIRLERIFDHANLSPTEEIIVYGNGSQDAQAVADLLIACGYEQVVACTESYETWAADTSKVIEKSSLSCCGAE